MVLGPFIDAEGVRIRKTRDPPTKTILGPMLGPRGGDPETETNLGVTETHHARSLVVWTIFVPGIVTPHSRSGVRCPVPGARTVYFSSQNEGSRNTSMRDLVSLTRRHMQNQDGAWLFGGLAHLATPQEL